MSFHPLNASLLRSQPDEEVRSCGGCSTIVGSGVDCTEIKHANAVRSFISRSLFSDSFALAGLFCWQVHDPLLQAWLHAQRDERHLRAFQPDSVPAVILGI